MESRMPQFYESWQCMFSSIIVFFFIILVALFIILVIEVCMEHKMKLYSFASFEELKAGKKKREYRLNDEKRKMVKVGDTIRFL